MKYFIAILLSASLIASDSQSNTKISLDEIKNWGNEAFGGHILINLKANNTEIVHLNRQHTSGIHSSEDTIFIKENKSYRIIEHFELKAGIIRNVTVDNNVMIVSEINPNTNASIEILRKSVVQPYISSKTDLDIALLSTMIKSPNKLLHPTP